VRGLYERGFGAEDVRQLFRLIDWLLALPPALDNVFWEEVEAYKEERAMPFITTPERIGIQRGLRLAIEDVLRLKFGDAGVALMPQLKEVYDAEQLRGVVKALATASSLDEVRQACHTAAQPTPPPKSKARRGKRKDS
jgi:hypothetical protein